MDVAKPLGELLMDCRRERGHKAALAGRLMAEASKRPHPWSRQMIRWIERGIRPISADLAQDIGRYLGIGPEAALIIAGHFPWLPTVDQAQRVVDIFRGDNAT